MSQTIRLTQDILREMIEESIKKTLSSTLNEGYQNRRQVSRDEIIDILNASDDSASNNGKFASVTYVKPVSVYKTKKSWRTDDMRGALDKYKERGEEDWHKKLTAFNQEDAKGKNPVQTVVVTQRYLLHWISQDKFRKDYTDYANKLSDLRMRNGIGLSSDGKLGDNRVIPAYNLTKQITCQGISIWPVRKLRQQHISVMRQDTLWLIYRQKY